MSTTGIVIESCAYFPPVMDNFWVAMNPRLGLLTAVLLALTAQTALGQKCSGQQGVLSVTGQGTVEMQPDVGKVSSHVRAHLGCLAAGII